MTACQIKTRVLGRQKRSPNQCRGHRERPRCWFCLSPVPKEKGISVTSVRPSTPHSAISRSSLPPSASSSYHPSSRCLTTNSPGEPLRPSSLSPFPHSSFSPPLLRTSLLLLCRDAYHTSRACLQRPEATHKTKARVSAAHMFLCALGALLQCRSWRTLNTIPR